MFCSSDQYNMMQLKTYFAIVTNATWCNTKYVFCYSDQDNMILSCLENTHWKQIYILLNLSLSPLSNTTWQNLFSKNTQDEKCCDD